MNVADRNLQALHSVTGRSMSEVSRLFGGFRPGLRVGPDVSITSSAYTAARLALGLLVRLYPSVALDGHGEAAEALRSEARRIRPDATLEGGADVWVVLSSSGLPILTTQREIYFGVKGWSALVSSKPVEVDPQGSVLALLVAACLAAWELFLVAAERAGFASAWTPPSYAWNLLSYRFSSIEEAPGATVDASKVCIPAKVMVGAGALGHGLAYGLESLPELHGILTIVDNRPIKGDTLQRYACQYASDRGAKVQLLHDRLVARGLEVVPVEKDYLSFLAEHAPTCEIEVMVAAVDRGDTRFRMQAALPKVLINGWTGHGKMGLSVHRFVDEEACLACLYAPRGLVDQSEEMRIHNGLRQAIPLERIRRMLHTNQALDESDIETLARQGIPMSVCGSYLGKTIQSAYQGLVCSGLIAAAPGDDPVDVPLAFMSALIGILQAVELVKLSVPDLRVHSLGSRLQFDVLRRPDFVFAPAGKRPGCICTDSQYIEAYRNKWRV